MILGQCLQGAGTRDAGDQGQRHDAQRQGGQDQVPEDIGQGPRVGRDDAVQDVEAGDDPQLSADAQPARRRQPSQRRSEGVAEQQADPEERQGHSRQRDDRGQPVGRRVAAVGRKNADGNAGRAGDHHREQGQLDGCGETLGELGRDRPVGEDGPAPVPADEAGQVAHILDRDRLVQPAARAELAAQLGRSVLAQHHLGRIAGDQPEESKHEDGEDEQRGQEQKQPPGQVSQHLAAPESDSPPLNHSGTVLPKPVATLCRCVFLQNGSVTHHSPLKPPK